MNKKGPIIVIEDDLDDQEILKEVFQELNYTNEILFFEDGHEAFDYLSNAPTVPFIIISDMVMPKLNGIELMERIRVMDNVRIKSIPYLLFTTVPHHQQVIDAYAQSIQGFFVKPSRIEDFSNRIKRIVEYWQDCEPPQHY